MKNGPIWDEEAQEYRVYLDDEFITWASSEPVANQIYNQARTTKYKHLSKHPNTEQQPETAWEWHTLTKANQPLTVNALDKAFQNV